MKFKEWLETDQGKTANNVQTVECSHHRAQEYLTSRLENAYNIGMCEGHANNYHKTAISILIEAYDGKDEHRVQLILKELSDEIKKEKSTKKTGG